MKAVLHQQIDLNDEANKLQSSENIPPEVEGEATQQELSSTQEEKSADNGASDGEVVKTTIDTSENGNLSVFEQVGWKAKVQDFLQAYPIAKDFSSQIGKIIAQSNELSHDESCLEKALATALASAYISPQQLAVDEEFLQKYVYSNQDLKDRIIQEYLDGLQQNLPPKSISSRGQITLTPPSRPTSIAEAGNVFKAMFNNRRI